MSQGYVMMPPQGMMQPQKATNNKSIIGLYGKDSTVVIAYKRMTIKDKEDEEKPKMPDLSSLLPGATAAARKLQASKEATGGILGKVYGAMGALKGALGNALGYSVSADGCGGECGSCASNEHAGPKAIEIREASDMDLEQDIINEHSLLKSYQENQYFGRSMYEGIGDDGSVSGVDIRILSGMVTDYAADEKTMKDALQSLTRQHSGISGPTRNIYHKVQKDIAKALGAMASRNPLSMRSSLAIDLLSVDEAGEVYMVLGQDPKLAGRYVVTPGVQKRLAKTWEEVGEERKRHFDKSNILVVGKARSLLKNSLEESCSKVSPEGGLNYTAEQLICEGLCTIQKINATAEGDAAPIREDEAKEIEVWVVPRKDNPEYKLENRIGYKLTPEEVKGYIKGLPEPKPKKKAKKKNAEAEPANPLDSPEVKNLIDKLGF